MSSHGRRLGFGRPIAALLTLGAAVIAAALAEARAYKLVRHMVRLDPGASPIRLRVLHISDTHYQRGQRAKAAFLASLASTHPDLVVFTGDMVGNDDSSVEEFMAAISGLLAIPGVFVRGSNDYFAPVWSNPLSYLMPKRRHLPARRRLDWHRLRDALVDAGWHDIDNDTACLQLGGLTLQCRGTDDAHIGRDRYSDTPGECDTPGLRIGVTHAPYRRVLAAMASDGLSLVLAGHTHGGQICLPWKGALVTNCDLPSHLAKGLFTWPRDDEGAIGDATNSIPVHVSAGVGTSPMFPLRLFCRPEACVIEIYREN